MPTITSVKSGVQSYYDLTWYEPGRNVATAASGRIWCTYWLPSGSYRQAYAAYSDDNGATWTEEAVNQAAVAYNDDPAIAVDTAGRPHVIWYDSYNRLVCHSYRESGAWQAYTVLDNDFGSGGGRVALAAGPDGRVHAMWNNPSARNEGYECQMLYRAWDGGWGSVQKLEAGPWTDLDVSNPYHDICVDAAGRVHAVWTARVLTEVYFHQLHYRCLSDGGWGPIEVWEQEDFSNWRYSSSIGADATGRVYAAWLYLTAPFATTDPLPWPDFWVRFREFDGSNWGPVQTAVVYPGDTKYNYWTGISVMALPDGNPAVVLAVPGYGSTSTRSNVIYHRRTGGAWSARQIISNQDNNAKYVSADEQHHYFVWSEYDYTTACYSVLFCTMEAAPSRRYAYFFA